MLNATRLLIRPTGPPQASASGDANSDAQGDDPVSAEKEKSRRPSTKKASEYRSLILDTPEKPRRASAKEPRRSSKDRRWSGGEEGEGSGSNAPWEDKPFGRFGEGGETWDSANAGPACPLGTKPTTRSPRGRK
eukprot:979794-Prorocentrum_minimum.AAC.1